MKLMNRARHSPPAGPYAEVEKCCLACREYWPLDAEFFEPAPLNPDGFSIRCLACIKERFWGVRRSPVRTG
jgi:hypothetical protein